MKWAAEFKYLNWMFFALLVTQSASASFEPLPTGGRAAGMSDAYSAIADDVYAVYYNPAGALQLERPEIGSYYSKLFSGLTDNSQISRSCVAFGYPFKKNRKTQAAALSYSSLQLSGLYKEDTFAVTYGREFNRIWNLGGSLKMLQKKIGTDQYTQNAIDDDGNTTGPDSLLVSGANASAISADLGVQYRLSKIYAFGASVRNINQPNMAVDSGKDYAPRILNVALARRLRSGSLDVEVMRWDSIGTNTRFMVGGENWFKNGFGIRAGAASGSRSFSTLSFGFSFRTEGFQFDYAAILPLQGIQGTMGTQQVSLTVRLGKAPQDPLESQLIKEKENRIKAETETRLALAERDRLKKQLIELTEKNQGKEKADKETAKAALAEAKAQEAQQAQDKQMPEKRGDAKAAADYTAALAKYNDRVQQGAGIKEKKQMLEKIQNQFLGTSVNLSTVRREIKSLQLEETRAEHEFELSLNFYRKLVQQGASLEERRGMLQRIIQKYRDTGVDVTPATEELNKIK